MNISDYLCTKSNYFYKYFKSS